MEKINISEKFRTFDKFWQSKIVGEFNGQYIKLAKIRGDFEWHYHKTEDEMMLVLRGTLNVKLHDREVELKEGEFFVAPCGVEHKLVCQDEVHLLVIEPKSTLNTGNVQDDPVVEDVS
ncbi:MAG: cupin domain-containing protein [Desulfobacterales bacterium]|nr:cupin domain-containing protein [Desulfobacterales bacterium]